MNTRVSIYTHVSMDGSVVEFSPATREARVQFPVHPTIFYYFGFTNGIPVQLPTNITTIVCPSGSPDRSTLSWGATR